MRLGLFLFHWKYRKYKDLSFLVTRIEINVTKNDYYTSKRHVILIRSGETSTRSINDLTTIHAL